MTMAFQHSRFNPWASWKTYCFLQIFSNGMACLWPVQKVMMVTYWKYNVPRISRTANSDWSSLLCPEDNMQIILSVQQVQTSVFKSSNFTTALWVPLQRQQQYENLWCRTSEQMEINIFIACRFVCVTYRWESRIILQTVAKKIKSYLIHSHK